MNMGAFEYEVSGSRLSIGLVRLMHAAIARITGRGMGLAMQAMKPLLHSQLSCVHFADGSRLYFRLDDVYWNGFIRQPPLDYEPEIGALLQRLKDVDYLFFDCGANIGYWSVLVTSEMLGRKRTIAVEPSQETIAILQQNCNANGQRFKICRKALSEHDGQRLFFFSNGPHAARHIAETQDGRSTHVEPVISTTIDALAQQLHLTDNDRIVVKLDVEGAEISALRGAHQVLKRDTLIIYEDHGSDPSHATTRFVFDALGFPIFSIAADGITEIKELGALDHVKKDPKLGYNFVTCPPRSGFHRRIVEAAASTRLSMH
ncbi:FkbM family methyltransferase [Bradyrhizobium paxllaeri]|uniref:FkbM family methyltransferase n=1 Tax=Bradyrhizobium paxllaeri TaxID=190148 RepID=UPI000B12F42F|nr:FkbM family methyltransferase [Bradyrhizobium paxllaeri]